MQFQTAFKVITTHDNMIVEVVFVNMSCDDDLTIFKDIFASSIPISFASCGEMSSPILKD